MKDSRYVLLTLLTAILAFNYVDRWALGVLLQDIKVDLRLTDTQLGFLTGLAFAAFYATLGIPIARWTDRGNRRVIVAITTGLWSVAVACCGLARSFGQLLFVRMCVAVGEAGCYPPALSLISEWFGRNERPRAVSRYMLGAPIAIVIGYLSAGWLSQFYGWRATFVIVGMPGLLLASLAWFMLVEPRSRLATEGARESSNEKVMEEPAPAMRQVVGTLWRNLAFRHILASFSIWGFFGYGLLQWQPAFFIRSHGLKTGELGTWLALVYGVGGVVGTWIGGELASRYAAKDERLQLIAISALYPVIALCTAGAYLASNLSLALAALGLSALIGSATNGPFFAATQTLVPPRMRGMSIALMFFFCNLIGMGLGPLAVGALSDAWTPWLGDESLRYALLAFCPGYFWCALHLWRASRTVARDMAPEQVTERAHEAARNPGLQGT